MALALIYGVVSPHKGTRLPTATPSNKVQLSDNIIILFPY